MGLNVLVSVSIREQAEFYRAAIVRDHPDFTVTTALTLAEAKAALPDADIFMGFGANLPRDMFADARRVKWVSALGTGLDGIIDSPHLAPAVVVTATRGIHGNSMSEAAFMLMLALTRDFPRLVHAQDRAEWKRWPPPLLHGRTVGILGVGMIAAEMAPRCKAFGMNVVGISRTARPVAGFDRMVARADLEKVAPELDYLILLIPLDEETRGIIGARVLAAMKPTAYLINLSRGGIVDEDALAQALQERRIAGAGLDAFVQEPLPPDHPLWRTPNTIIMPHVGGTYDRYVNEAYAQFKANLGHFLAGHPERMTHRER